MSSLSQVAGSLDRLQRTVQNLFPYCTRQREVGGGSFTPHVTLGQFESLSAVEAKIAELSRESPVEFDVDFLSLLARTATGPFQCKHTAKLFSGSNLLAASTDSMAELGDLFGSQSIPIHDTSVPALSKFKKEKEPYTGPKTGNAKKVKPAKKTAAPVADDSDFGSLFSSGTIPISSGWTDEASSSEPATDSLASGSSSYARKPRATGTEFKSSYYKEKPAPVKSSPKATTAAAKNSPTKPAFGASPSTTSTSALGSFSVSAPPQITVPTAPVSKYALSIEPPTAPKFNTFATTPLTFTSTLSTKSESPKGSNTPTSPAKPSSYASLGTFTPSKPPAPVVLSSPKKEVSPKSAAKPAAKASPKPKVSSYYKGEKRAVVGRRSETGEESSAADDISNMFHVEMDPYVEPETTYKVLSKPSSSVTVPKEHEQVLHRVTEWIVCLPQLKRPRNRTKLGNSITKMCTTTASGISAEEALSTLIAEGHISVAGDKVTIPTKGDKATQRENMVLAAQIEYSTERQAAMGRCTSWILDPDNTPKTRAALLNTLSQLVQTKKQLSPALIVQYLIDAGQLTVLQDDKGIEHLEYNL